MVTSTSNTPRRTVESWTRRGVNCAVLVGVGRFEGAIQLTEALRAYWGDDAELLRTLPLRRSAKLIGDGWVIVDARHTVYALWDLDELARHAPKFVVAMAEDTNDDAQFVNHEDYDVDQCSIKTVRQDMETFADLVATWTDDVEQLGRQTAE